MAARRAMAAAASEAGGFHARRIVRLNVGGQLFVTTRDTLMRQGQHMLSAMFSGMHEVPADEDGYVHIDRDGRYFPYILNFLRDGTVALPESWELKEAILNEAQFYALQPLIQLIDHHMSDMFRPMCQIAVVTSALEEARLITTSKNGAPIIKFVYHRGNNKFSYTQPSDDMLLRNIELFDKISRKFCRRVTFVKDTSGRTDHICTWFFYGAGRLISEVCCTSIVYSSDKKHTKIEFPEARLYEECLNILLYEKQQEPSVVVLEDPDAETGDYMARHSGLRAGSPQAQGTS